MTILHSTQLLHITGGQQTATPPQSVEDRARDLVREELDLREREDLRAFERSHPFTALICQGDRDCLRSSRR
jgi:hypothetical protein